ncbi:MAG: outer membrane protein assembly factor BamA [Bauldia sp.]|nr:outer membrane protein assembly factor BamA [Bauldia sp.]
MVFLAKIRKAALALGFVLSAPVTMMAAMTIATEAHAATLTSIQVSGNVRVDSATIRSYVPVRIGQNYTQGDLNTTLSALFVTGLFANVTVTGTSGTIYIAVVENPVAVQVGFVGNRKVDDSELAGIVLTASRGVVSESLIAADTQRIIDRYDQIGRSVVVTVDIQSVGENAASVVFNIQEGDRIRIETIDFVGNDAFSDRQLSTVIRTRDSNILSWLTKNDIYSEEGSAIDSELLRRFYVENGYADFQVIAVDAVFDEARGSYVITYTVAEGPQYRIGPVSVDSTVAGMDGTTLRGAVHVVEGRVFSSRDLEQTLEDITVRLANAGHPFATVTPRANRDYANNTIGLTFIVDEGARNYIERIEIVGNTRTRDYVIRREFDLAEGDAYNRVLVDRIERRLANLGIFDDVQIAEQRGSGPDLVVLVVRVAERRTGEVSATAGYSTADGLIGEVSLTEQNFLGRGQYLRVSLSIGRNNRNLAISFTEPYFLGRRMPIGFDVYGRQTQATSTRPFSSTVYGGQIRIGLTLTEHLSTQLSYRFNSQTIAGSTNTNLFPDGTTVTSSVGYGVTYQNVDNVQNPSRGFYFNAALEYAGLGGNNSFLRSTLDTRAYIPLGYRSPLTAAFRFRAGNITGIGQNVRVLDNFFMGGDDIRGFADLGFGPRTDDADAQAIGGRTYWIGTAELRFPIPVIGDLGFRAALFADAGVLTGVDGPLPGPTPFLDTGALRASVGASVMWASPFGLIRVDFAKVLAAAPYDIQQPIRLSVGGTF